MLVALVALAAWYFTGRALRPVEAIRAEAEAITGSTIHRRVPEPDTDDEVGRLARTMNAMLDRLDDVVADANASSCPTRRTSCAARSRRSARTSRSRSATPTAPTGPRSRGACSRRTSAWRTR